LSLQESKPFTHTLLPRQEQFSAQPVGGFTQWWDDVQASITTQAAVSGHSKQSATFSHWMAGTHPPQHPACTLGTSPGGHVGGKALQKTFEPSQS